MKGRGGWTERGGDDVEDVLASYDPLEALIHPGWRKIPSIRQI